MILMIWLVRRPAADAGIEPMSIPASRNNVQLMSHCKPTSTQTYTHDNVVWSSCPQAILSSLRYYYPTSSEPLPGNRKVSINVTNSYRSSATLDLTVTVKTLNNHAPILVLNGNSTAVFNEGSGTLNIGAVYRIQVSDQDNDSVFPQQALIVTINGVVDVGYESLSLNGSKCFILRH